jgi:hypothetical protein
LCCLLRTTAMNIDVFFLLVNLRIPITPTLQGAQTFQC